VKLILTRYWFSRTTTLGRLAVVYDGPRFYDAGAWHPQAVPSAMPLDFGFVCEDEDRGLVATDPAACARLKVRRETAIPTGTYEVLHTHSPKYGRPVMEVLRVPAFAGIRIHPGTDEGDTEGCLLPGLARDERRGFVFRSTAATEWLDARVKECTARGERVTLLIEREPSAWAAFQRAGGADGAKGAA
jgi:hypothetical protein